MSETEAVQADPTPGEATTPEYAPPDAPAPEEGEDAQAPAPRERVFTYAVYEAEKASDGSDPPRTLKLVATVQAPTADAARWLAVDQSKPLQKRIEAKETAHLVVIAGRLAVTRETKEEVVERRIRR